MIRVSFKASFVRAFDALPHSRQEEAFEKIELFKDRANHRALRVHKLKGRLAGRHSFSVNYRYRIVFTYNKAQDEAYLLAIGDHTIYE